MLAIPVGTVIPGMAIVPAPDGPLLHPNAAAPTSIVFIAQSSRV